jgi:hypothetical protein
VSRQNSIQDFAQISPQNSAQSKTVFETFFQTTEEYTLLVVKPELPKDPINSTSIHQYLSSRTKKTKAGKLLSSQLRPTAR